MFTFPFYLFKDFYRATHTFEKTLNGSESEAGEPISVFDYNLFNFALASSVYDLEELAAVIVQARGNLRAIENDAVATLSASLDKSLVLAGKILRLLLRANSCIQSYIFLCDSNSI
ncbi:MAG TPA: hypothetical protein PLG04_08480 [Anaerolineaceae bacterium]|nr:hypothetical protein [Anaerolineaceae bacterium]